MGDWVTGFDWLLEQSKAAAGTYCNLRESLTPDEIIRWDNVQTVHMQVENTTLTQIRTEREKFQRRLDETEKFGGIIAALIQYWRNHLAICRDVDDYILLGQTLGTAPILERIRKYNNGGE
jgi:hypothetical protein